VGRHTGTRLLGEHPRYRPGRQPDPGPSWPEAAAGHGHAHGGHVHDGHGSGQADGRGRILLAAILIPCALATVVGLITLWPGHRHYPVPLQFQTASGGAVTFVTGEVLVSKRGHCTGSTTRACLVSAVELKDGSTTGLEFPDGPGAPRLAPGDHVRLARTTDPQNGSAAYVYDDEVRDLPLGLLALAFAVVVVAVARWRGLAALAGLGLAYGVLVLFVLPALLAGEPALPVGLVASAAILFAVLYLAHGPSARTSAALAGTLLSLALTGVLAELATGATRITGLSSEELPALRTSAPQVSFTGLVLCGVVIGALGVLNDVTVTQASAVWELSAADPTATGGRIFTAAMRIGRDHIASSVYTLLLAYAGAAIPVLLLVSLSGRSVHDIVTGDQVAEEALRTLVGGIGLVAAIPITTALAAATVTRRRRRR
jgi:uncharacterized membrane protein